MRLSTTSSPHIHSGNALGVMMLRVLMALVPGIIIYIHFFGWGVLINILLAVITAVICEAAVLKLRNRPLMPTMGDNSTLLTATLLALTLPPLAPWWLVVTGTFFAVVFAKHLYGGLGFNPFNPAMIGYVVLLISFPREITNWLPPEAVSGYHVGFGEALSVVFGGTLANGQLPDAISMATPLDMLKTQLTQQHIVSEVIANSPIYSHISGLGWEWIAIAYLVGGCWLVYKKVINWHIPVSLLTTLFIVSSLFWLYDPERFASPLFHLFSGAAILCAFFIATDPVTASTTNRGRLIYGATAAILIYVIRTWGSYPDGVAFAVLLVNMIAPTLDYYTQPRVFGRGK